jgi:hypothetical protein
MRLDKTHRRAELRVYRELARAPAPHPAPADAGDGWTAIERILGRRVLRDPPPGLQALIRTYGGYGQIPAEAWREYDGQMAEWNRGP